MENLNAEAVKKALECCTLGDCYPCPYGNIGAGCRDKMSEDALALINLQEQRIKELTEENERLRAENEALAISEVKECEISQMLVYRIRDKHPAVMAVIADTVSKMQEMVYEFADDLNTIDAYIIKEMIDEVAKEMLEGDNEN